MIPVSDAMPPWLVEQIDPPHETLLPPMLQHRTAASAVVVSEHCGPGAPLELSAHMSAVSANGCSGCDGGGGSDGGGDGGGCGDGGAVIQQRHWSVFDLHTPVLLPPALNLRYPPSK